MECEKEFHAKLSDLFLLAPAMIGSAAQAGRVLIAPESAMLPVSPARAGRSWRAHASKTA